jgi:predicted small metal-binding protein
MADLLTAGCACGWSVTGDEDEVVRAVGEHGQRVHNMTASREAVLANATRIPAPVAPDDAGDPDRDVAPGPPGARAG